MAGRRTRRRIRTLIAVGGAALVAVGVTGCGEADVAGAPVERKVFAFEGEALTIDSEDSELVLVPADVEDVEVSRQVDGWVVAGEGPKAGWRLEGGKLTLRLECRAMISDCQSRHEVKVPRGVAVTVQGDNGSVSADGFRTALKVQADNGLIKVKDATGPLELQSDNGEIVVDRAASKSVIARADNGSVRLTFGAVPQRVETTSDNGEITVELPRGKTAYAVETHSENGEVKVDVPRDGSSAHIVKARSDNGDITVRTADSAN
ncbi:DUF4097 family beta strand repeat-containing protein [Streptomyces sp. NPDC003036]|uniref:DUF4097 family beta strand repeat-containing protein n=1 Tax=Streptomyces sp. NPDC003036 TaxID=3154442 RepID=UPI0033A862B2